MTAAFDAWWVEQRLLADAPPRAAREPLWLAEAGARIGSIEPALGSRLVDARLPLSRSAEGWHVEGAADEALERIAQWLNANGLGGRWRDERLAVTDDAGKVVGRIERAAVRPLGIATHAVHLVGKAPAGGVWLQLRALDKDTDPGLWDTTVGGLIAADETVVEALQRESLEEAGLSIESLGSLRSIGMLVVRRPLPGGYMVEHIHTFSATVPDGVQPVNRDGEVERFECVAAAQLPQRVMQGEFTAEAGLILAHWLAPPP